MPPYIDSSVLNVEQSLDNLATSIRATLCSSAPANFAGIAGVALAHATHTAGVGNGSYTKANGDVSGRKLVIAQRTGVSPIASGMATHIAYDDGTTLKASTELLTPLAVTMGANVTITSHKWEIQAPSAS